MDEPLKLAEIEGRGELRRELPREWIERDLGHWSDDKNENGARNFSSSRNILGWTRFRGAKCIFDCNKSIKKKKSQNKIRTMFSKSNLKMFYFLFHLKSSKIIISQRLLSHFYSPQTSTFDILSSVYISITKESVHGF